MPSSEEHSSSDSATISNPLPLTCLAVLSVNDSVAGTAAAGDPSPVWQVSWSPDGRILASCHGSPDPCVRVWKRRAAVEGLGGEAAAARPNRRHQPRQEQTWTLSATLRGAHTRTVRSVAIAPVGTGTGGGAAAVIASASFDGTVAVWERFDEEDIAAGEETQAAKEAGGYECTAVLEGHESEVKCVAWNGTGTLLATAGRDKSVWIWDSFLPGTGGGGGGGEFECIAVLHGHSGDVKWVEFAPSNGQWGDGE